MQTPHSGYHWDGNSDRFFEGWYYRVSLGDEHGFAFMYSIEDPIGDQPYSGGAAQILTSGDRYLCRTFPNLNLFWASKNSLGLGHWRKNNLTIKPQLLDPALFEEQIPEGYQATDTLNQGYIQDPASGNYCRWYYTIKPIYGWGNPQLSQQATAGWLSYLPIFDPGWQVLMAHGLATGYIDWHGKVYQFIDAPAYSEKNWGHSFPKQWFWLNCNHFLDESELSLTAVGGIRKVFWWQEEVGMIGLHYQGNFYEFAPWNSRLNWDVAPWGKWQMSAQNEQFVIEIVGTTDLNGAYVRVPTASGLQFCCRDTMKGKLIVTLKTIQGKTLLKAYSLVAGLEVGGHVWEHPWQFSQ